MARPNMHLVSFNAYTPYTLLCIFQLTSDQLFGVYQEFCAKYPVVSIEDAFDQDDWDAWTKMNAAMDVQLVG